MDKDADGNYLISARDACGVYKINGTTGEVIWRLGGRRSDFVLGPNVPFCFQHHARFVKQSSSEEVISIFDNSAHGTENGGGNEVHKNKFSQGKIITVNKDSWTARIIAAFQPPDGLLAKSQGSTQLLPNGNALVNWGSEGAMTEFRGDGTPIFHAYMDSDFLGEGVENYRAFRYNWTGIPTEEPAIVAHQTSAGTAIYVSWNGDTETAAWRFYAITDQYGSRSYLGQAQRDGFETSFLVAGQSYQQVAAEALSAQGRKLTTTRVAQIQEEVLPPASDAGSSNLESTGDGLEETGSWMQVVFHS